MILLTGAAGLASAGCERAWWIGFLDPTQVGRFEAGSKRRAIQRTLSILDEPEGIPGATEPTSEDLIVEYVEPPLQPSDVIELSIFELIEIGQEFRIQKRINNVGYMNIPEIGNLKIAGMTPRALELFLRDHLIQQQKLVDPQVSVTVLSSETQQYNVLGSVSRPGRYTIPRPDFRLLDVLAEVGGASFEIKTVYVTRSSPSRMPSTQSTNEAATDQAVAPVQMSSGIESWPFGDSQVEETVPAQPATAATQPAATQESAEIEPLLPPPATEPQEPMDDVAELLGEDRAPPPMVYDATRKKWVPLGTVATQPEPGTLEPQRDSATQPPPGPAEPFTPESGATQTAPGQDIDWETLAQPESVTRVIEVPMEPLLNGDPRYNIVIRSHDLINVAPGPIGEFYVMGNVLRPGAYTLTGRELGVREAIAAAGGFGPLATPSRAELIRRGPGDEEEIRSIDLDAIFAGKSNNFYLRPNDIVNVGTNPLMPFLATIRNAFRVSYGFGFVYDRNFADIDSFSGQQNPTDRRRSEQLQRGFPL